MPDINKPLQFTSLDGKTVVKATYSHQTPSKGYTAVDVSDDNSEDVLDTFDNGPYLFRADGSHFKGRTGPLTNVAEDTVAAAAPAAVPANAGTVEGESYLVNDTPAQTMGAALILAGQVVSDGKAVEITKVTIYRRTTAVAAFAAAA